MLRLIEVFLKSNKIAVKYNCVVHKFNKDLMTLVNID